PPPEERRSHLSARGGDRDEQQCDESRPEEDQRAGAELLDRDPDHEVRNAPDHRHRHEQDPAAPRHLATLPIAFAARQTDFLSWSISAEYPGDELRPCE